MIVFFIGYMGSGKSTLGKRVARKLGIPFFDMDNEIEKQVGAGIPEIFEKNGEKEFRKMETSFLTSFIKTNISAIVATGGGTPCFNDNISIMNENGLTVYLNRPVKELANRIHHSKKSRPLVDHFNLEELQAFIETHLSERQEFYLNSEYNVSRENQTTQKLVELLLPYFEDDSLEKKKKR